jgi:hypothetical protein
MVFNCARLVQRRLHPHMHLARRLIWSPLRASSDHSFFVGGSASTKTMPAASPLPFQAHSSPLRGWGLIDLPLRASNEGLLRPRVARAQKIIRLHPLFLLLPNSRFQLTLAFMELEIRPFAHGSFLSFLGSLSDLSSLTVHPPQFTPANSS